MAKERFFEGKPRTYLEPRDLEDANYWLSTAHSYGHFAYSFHSRLRRRAPLVPEDILLAGDNWYQLVRVNGALVNAVWNEELSAKETLSIGPLNTRIEEDMLLWELREAKIKLIFEGQDVEGMYSRLTLLDRSSEFFPTIKTENVAFSLDPKPWGEVLFIRNWELTEVYRVTDFSL